MTTLESLTALFCIETSLIATSAAQKKPTEVREVHLWALTVSAVTPCGAKSLNELLESVLMRADSSHNHGLTRDIDSVRVDDAAVAQ